MSNPSHEENDRRRLTLLIAEDDEHDRIYVERLLLNTGVVRVAHVPTGPDVVKYLSGEKPYDDRRKHPLPDALLLDHGLPGMNGFEVIDWIAQNSTFQHLPIYMLSGSTDPRLRSEGVKRGLAGFFIKPLGLAHLGSILGDRVGA